MQSRVRQAFRPGWASTTGADYLEYRSLLSAVVATGDTSEVAQVPAVASSTTDSRGEDHSSSPAQSEGESTPSDASEPGAAIAAIASSVKATVVHGASEPQQGASVDPTPWDEGGGTRIAEALALEQSGGGGVVIIAGAGTTGAGTGSAGPIASVASPVTAPSTPPVSVLPGTANEVMATSVIDEDGALLMSAGPDTYQMPAGFVPSPAPRDVVTPEPGEEARSDVEGVAPESAPIAEPDLSPHYAGPLTEFLPFDRASLEDAIDRFLAPLEELGTELLDWRPSPGLVHAAAFVTAATVATAVVRRRLLTRGAAEYQGEEAFARFPGHPLAWGFGEP